MTICCLEDFKKEFDKLTSKNSYKDLGEVIIQYFFNKKVAELSSGTRLNGHSEIPYIKKRIKGSGGYRLYYLLLIKDDTTYLMFVHPKTGVAGIDNISDEFKSELYKKVLNCIKTHDFYYLSYENNRLIFTPTLSHVREDQSIEYMTVKKVDPL